MTERKMRKGDLVRWLSDATDVGLVSYRRGDLVWVEWESGDYGHFAVAALTFADRFTKTNSKENA